MTTLSDVWNAERARVRSADRRVQRRAILTVIITHIARHLPRWRKVRASVLQLGGFGFISYGLWEWSPIAGLIAVGVSLLLFEEYGGGQ